MGLSGETTLDAQWSPVNGPWHSQQGWNWTSEDPPPSTARQPCTESPPGLMSRGPEALGPPKGAGGGRRIPGPTQSLPLGPWSGGHGASPRRGQRGLGGQGPSGGGPGRATDELAAQLGAGTDVLGAQDDGVDHAEQGGHVGHVVAVRELVHDDAEAVLLTAHRLQGGRDQRAPRPHPGASHPPLTL